MDTVRIATMGMGHYQYGTKHILWLDVWVSFSRSLSSYMSHSNGHAHDNNHIKYMIQNWFLLSVRIVLGERSHIKDTNLNKEKQITIKHILMNSSKVFEKNLSFSFSLSLSLSFTPSIDLRISVYFFRSVFLLSSSFLVSPFFWVVFFSFHCLPKSAQSKPCIYNFYIRRVIYCFADNKLFSNESSTRDVDKIFQPVTMALIRGKRENDKKTQQHYLYCCV